MMWNLLFYNLFLQALNEPDDSAAEHWEDLQDVSVSFDPEMSR